MRSDAKHKCVPMGRAKQQPHLGDGASPGEYWMDRALR